MTETTRRPELSEKTTRLLEQVMVTQSLLNSFRFNAERTNAENDQEWHKRLLARNRAYDAMVEYLTELESASVLGE